MWQRTYGNANYVSSTNASTARLPLHDTSACYFCLFTVNVACEFKTIIFLRNSVNLGMDSWMDFFFQIYVLGKLDAKDTTEMLSIIRKYLIPGRVLMLVDQEQQDNILFRKNVIVNKMKPQNGRATVLVCRDHTCSLPVTNPNELASLLDNREVPDLWTAIWCRWFISYCTFVLYQGQQLHVSSKIYIK